MSNIANISTAIVRHKETFTEIKQSLLSYARPFEKKCSLRFVDLCIMDIVCDMMSSSVLATNSWAAYVRYITAGEIMMKRKCVLVLLTNLGRDAPAVKALGVTHLDDRSLYFSFEDDIYLMIRAPNEFVKNNNNPAHFHTHSFHKHETVLFDALHTRRLQQDDEQFPTL